MIEEGAQATSLRLGRGVSIWSESVVDAQDVPGDEARLLRQQPADITRHLRGLTHSHHRMHGLDAALVVRSERDLTGDQIGASCARRNGVDADVLRGVIARSTW